MKKPVKRKPYALASGIAAAALAAGCSGEKKAWENAPGTKGFINLDAVKEAFLATPEVGDFEKRVNEIYEGDCLVLVKAEKGPKGFVLQATEDLDGSKEVSAGDDPLFRITVEDAYATLEGQGVNRYYKERFAYNPKPPEEYTETSGYASNTYPHHHSYFHYWHHYPLWGGYYTRRDRYPAILDGRDSFRQTSGFENQIRTNDTFANTMSAKHGSAFTSSLSSLSSARTSYVQRAGKSFNSSVQPAAKTSGWGTRSAMKSGAGYTGAKAFSSTRTSGFRSSSGRSSGIGGSRSSSGFGV